jgi:hypothetical protein
VLAETARRPLIAEDVLVRSYHLRLIREFRLGHHWVQIYSR